MVRDLKNNNATEKFTFEKLWLARNSYTPQARYGLTAPNIMIVGMPGIGKSRYILSPTILQYANMGTSMVVIDAKGSLYRKYAKFIENLGYKVKIIDIANPGNIRKKAKNHTEYHVKYNPFQYIRSEYDVLKLAYMLVHAKGEEQRSNDRFWDEASVLLMSAAIAYMMEEIKPKQRTMRTLIDTIRLIGEQSDECTSRWVSNGTHERTKFDDLFIRLGEEKPDSFAYRQYDKFKTCPSKTYNTVIVTTLTTIGHLDTTEVAELMSADECDLTSIDDEKTIVFISVSDTDRSLDTLTNILLTQMLNELCYHADNDFEEQRLPIDVMLMFDDFATNAVIPNFNKNVAGFRSRGISTMMLLQCESQLEDMYTPAEMKSLICNCSTYVYLGGNDVSTAENIATRCNVPTDEILSMPLGNCFIFRVGETAKQDKLLDLDEVEKEIGYTDYINGNDISLNK